MFNILSIVLEASKALSLAVWGVFCKALLASVKSFDTFLSLSSPLAITWSLTKLLYLFCASSMSFLAFAIASAFALASASALALAAASAFALASASALALASAAAFALASASAFALASAIALFIPANAVDTFCWTLAKLSFLSASSALVKAPLIFLSLASPAFTLLPNSALYLFLAALIDFEAIALSLLR